MAQCQHGLPAAECLICKTLGTGHATQVQEAPRAGWWRRGDRSPAGAAPVPVTTTPRQAAPRNAPAGPHPRPIGRHLGLIVVAVVVIAAVAWLASGVVSVVLHGLELALIAAVAGWIGYRIGHFRGRYERR